MWVISVRVEAEGCGKRFKQGRVSKGVRNVLVAGAGAQSLPVGPASQAAICCSCLGTVEGTGEPWAVLRVRIA